MIRERLAYYKRLAQFVNVRIGNYVELGLLEVTLYKNALLRSIVAYVAMLFCILFSLAFLSIAVLVSYWDTDVRVTTAWWIFGVWLVLALIALLYAQGTAPQDAPASVLSEQIKLDLHAIRGGHE
jgi:uncharacterized membrane protein YqjE